MSKGGKNEKDMGVLVVNSLANDAGLAGACG